MNAPLIQNVVNAQLPTIDRADGVWLMDTQGRRYIDGCAGAVVSAIGHSHPRVLATIREQSERVTFTHRGAFTSSAIEEMAARLTRMTRFAGAWFVNSGSEAVEAAMQFALQYYREIGEVGRDWFLSHEAGYHGNTLGGLSLSGHARREVVGALAYGFPRLPRPYAYRDARDMTEAEYTDQLLCRARAIFAAHADRVAGVVIEPVGGATLGATVPPAGYLQGIRALCDEYGILLIADEVLTGLGRTGSILAVDHWNVRPDIVALGKGLGAGYTPIAATLINERILDAIVAGSGRIRGGHTYGGNPLSAAIGSTVLDILETENLIEVGAQTSGLLAEGLVELMSRHPLIGDARGIGMLRAIEISTDCRASDPASPQGALAARLARVAMEHGLVLYATTGGFNDAVLIAPPLTISNEEVLELLRRLDAALSVLESDLQAEGTLAAALEMRA